MTNSWNSRFGHEYSACLNMSLSHSPSRVLPTMFATTNLGAGGCGTRRGLSVVPDEEDHRGRGAGQERNARGDDDARREQRGDDRRVNHERLDAVDVAVRARGGVRGVLPPQEALDRERALAREGMVVVVVAVVARVGVVTAEVVVFRVHFADAVLALAGHHLLRPRVQRLRILWLTRP